jgi:SAM-dependent methyltransferase
MNEEELRKLISKYNPHHKSVDDRVVEVSKYLNLNLYSNSLVLDAGCGEGKWSRLYKYIDGEIVRTDIIAEDLRRNRNVKFRVCGTIESLPYKDNLFDLIICEWVVEHFNNPEAVRKEFYIEKLLLTTANNPWYFKFNKVLCLGYILFERICARLNFGFIYIYIRLI